MGGGGIAQWLADMLTGPAAMGLNHGSWVLKEKFPMLPIQWTVKKLDQIHPVMYRSQLVLKKKFNESRNVINVQSQSITIFKKVVQKDVIFFFLIKTEFVFVKRRRKLTSGFVFLVWCHFNWSRNSFEIWWQLQQLLRFSSLKEERSYVVENLICQVCRALLSRDGHSQDCSPAYVPIVRLSKPSEVYILPLRLS